MPNKSSKKNKTAGAAADARAKPSQVEKAFVGIVLDLSIRT